MQISRYVRLHGFYRLLGIVSPQARSRRMRKFAQIFMLKSGMRVLDLGGSTTIWKHIETPLDITVLNLPEAEIDKTNHGRHKFSFVDGDATAVSFPDYSFDIVFSNSCIEHVGAAAMQAKFASEVRRLARNYYVQTPSIIFPLEAHTGLPFWWFYPPPLKQALIRRWRKTLPAWCEMVEGTTVLSKRELIKLFPDSILTTEKVLGIPKSYVLYKSDSGD